MPPIVWQFGQDLRYALRTLRANPGFTLVAAATMALGIGVNTGLFTLVNAALFRPTPVGDPRALFEVGSATDSAEFIRFRQGCASCREVAAYNWVLPALGGAGQGEIVHGNEVSSNYFRAAAIQPAAGRFFNDDDYGDLGGNAIVLNFDFWQRQYRGDTSAIGGSVKLGGRGYTIVGVAPRRFIGTLPLVAKFWSLLPQAPQAGLIHILVRTNPGASRRQVEDELTSIRRQFTPPREGAAPDSDRVRLQSRANLIPLNPATASLAGLLMLCVGLVLLIACANVANLVLARSASRQREISVRLALGASRPRLLRQLFTESLAISTLGGVMAMFVAIWSLPALSAFIQSRMPELWGQFDLTLSPDLRVFAYTAAICVGAAMLFGFVPALMSTRIDVASGLKDGGSQGVQWSRSRLRNGLVVAQVALCLILLINAGLLARSLANSYADHPGFDADRNLIVQFDIGELEPDRTLSRQMLDRLASLPGVESVAAGRMVPLLGSGFGSVSSTRAADSGVRAGFNQVSPSYFHTLGVPLLSGRTFTAEEEQIHASVAVLSEAAANKLFARDNPLGRTVTLEGFLAGRSEPKRTAVVIGVARDARNLKLAEVDSAFVYLPVALDRPAAAMHYFVRARRNPTALLPSLRQNGAELSRGHQLLVYPFDIAIGYQRMPAQAGGAVSGVLGLLAMVLATVGIYGVISFSVSQRTREIGIRMAIGATTGDVSWMVLRQGLRLVGTGVIIGIAGAIPLARVIRSVMNGVTALDPLTFIAVPLFLGAIAVSAMALPVMRAARVEPVAALHHE
jgi:predicted permease